MNRPATNRGYYLFVKDDIGCMVEQDEEGNMQLVKDTYTSQVLPTDQITEAEAETYQIPGYDQPPTEDDIEMISSTSTTDYDREEVEASLMTIANAFHTIGQEYEKLVGVVPQMKKM